jgi:hypothetical protein
VATAPKFELTLMKTKIKKKLLANLASHLKYFKPHLHDHFVCPTCLAEIPTKNIEKISVAHIIPKSADGNLTTFICKRCNDTFGHKQDRWLGDVLKVLNSPYPSALAANKRSRQINICGLKVNSNWRITETGGLELLIDYRQNDPAIIRPETRDGKTAFSGKLIETLGKNKQHFNIQIPLPILGKNNFINVGFLTAAYLLWFRSFGYSWVFQKNLDIVRKQIQTPEEKVINFNYCILHKEINMNLWYGLIPAEDLMIPAMGLSHAFVILPQRDIPDFYNQVAARTLTFKPSKIKTFAIEEKLEYGPPHCVIYEDKVIVCPELMSEQYKSIIALFYHNKDDKPMILGSITKAKFDELSQQENAAVWHHKYKID